MTQPFSRSLRSLDPSAGWSLRIAQLAGALLAGAWCLWFFGVKVQVAVRSEHARVEASAASHPVQAAVGGAVLESALRLGASVRAGDVLVELEATEPSNELSKLHAAQAALTLEREAIEQQMAAVARALDSDRDATRARLEEGRALADEARALAALGAETHERKRALGEHGVLSKLDVLASVSEAEASQRRVVALELASRRIQAERAVGEAERAELLAALRRERVALDGRLATNRAHLGVLERELERRRIRAPISGELGDVVPLTAGSVVQAGQTLASVVPGGGLRVVAEFAPGPALGRLRRGQRAQMRLDAFPWTAHGHLLAEVLHVAREVRAGTLRVELAIDASNDARLPLEHGLSGSVRVEVERLSPAELAFRAAGRVFRAAQVKP